MTTHKTGTRERLARGRLELLGAPPRLVPPPPRLVSPPPRLVSPPPWLVHLELHTHDLEAASAFYAELLAWRTERIVSEWGCYHALLLGDGIDGGIVECGAQTAGWLPYVAVDRIDTKTERARELGASVLLGPREGPAGWRSVVSTPAGGEVALWQQKR